MNGNENCLTLQLLGSSLLFLLSALSFELAGSMKVSNCCCCSCCCLGQETIPSLLQSKQEAISSKCPKNVLLFFFSSLIRYEKLLFFFLLSSNSSAGGLTDFCLKNGMIFLNSVFRKEHVCWLRHWTESRTVGFYFRLCLCFVLKWIICPFYRHSSTLQYVTGIQLC